VTADDSIVVRRAALSDAPELANLERKLFATDAWSKNMIVDELSGDYRHYWVLEHRNHASRTTTAPRIVVGYGGVLVLGGEGDIQTLAVSEQIRGRGWGRTLLLRLIESAELLGASSLFLEVRADNLAAKSLYVSENFQEIGVRRAYYQPDGVDAVMMRRRLTQTSPRSV
jgi:ribosomal-protein-alanine N-acetyltransferase